MHEALYYEVKGADVICKLCPHMCRLAKGESGLCRTRINNNGQLYTLAFGNPCALHDDPIEKKPLFHFLPGSRTLSLSTAGCNLACLNCQNHSISQATPLEIEQHRLLPNELVEMALQKGCQSIAYTYTDPVVYYEYMLAIARLAKSKGIKNVLVSAGYINPAPLKKLLTYIDAANIDLKTFNDAVYQKLSGVRLKPVLNTLLSIKEAGVWLEICNLIIPQYTDDRVAIEQMIEWLCENGFTQVPIHFNRFVPAHVLRHLDKTPRHFLFEIAQLAKEKGLKHVYVGNVGDNPYSHTYCPHCEYKHIKRTAYSVSSYDNNYGKCKACGKVLQGVWF